MNKTIQALNKRKIPIVKIDNSLRQYREKPLFQDKVENANKVLAAVKLPKTRQDTTKTNS